MKSDKGLLQKKVVFMIDKYFVCKRKSVCLVKGIIGAIICWVYQIYYLFGAFSNYRKIVAENINQVNASETLKQELEMLIGSPVFIFSVIAVVIISLVIGYLFICVMQILIDLIRRQVFQGFEVKN